MATTTTLFTVRGQLVTTLSARSGLDGVTVARGWPGADSDGEMVVLASTADIPELASGTSQIPTLKSGRKHRAEDYRIPVTVSVASARPLATVEARVEAIWNEVEDTLADDPQIDGLSDIHWALIGDFQVLCRPLEKGWWVLLESGVDVRARLQ